MDGYPVFIRLIDPHCTSSCRRKRPVGPGIELRIQNWLSLYWHRGYQEVQDLERMLAAVESMHESNPMMGCVVFA